jgi:hypothetical protein
MKRNKKGQFIKGIKYQLGYKHTNITKNKMKKARKKQGSNVWNKGTHKSGMLGKHHTEEGKNNIGKSQIGIKNHMWGRKGKNHPRWKGGLTSLARNIRNHFKSRQWSSDILQRDNYTCQTCGKRGGYLNAHHIKDFSKIINEYNIKTLDEALNCGELWNLNNGKTLCLKCHNKTKNRWKNI